MSFLIIWCHCVAVLPPANRCIADRGFEYRYIAPCKPTHERTIISITQSSHTNHQQQVRSKNRISQIPISVMISSWMFHLISDVISNVWRTGPRSTQILLKENDRSGTKILYSILIDLIIEYILFIVRIIYNNNWCFISFKSLFFKLLIALCIQPTCIRVWDTLISAKNANNGFHLDDSGLP